MSLNFQRPVGVHRDISELQFIAALLQTRLPDICTRGTVTVADVVLYLRSRHAIDASEADVERLIFTDLAGQLQETTTTTTTTTLELQEKEEVSDVEQFDESHLGEGQIVGGRIDICQLVALLVIPELLQPPALETSLVKPLEHALRELPGGRRNAMESFRTLTCDNLRQVFANAGEFHVSEDLLLEMVQISESSDAIADALTADIRLYHSSNGGAAGADTPKHKDAAADLVTIVTFPGLDTVAQTFRRPFYTVLLWPAGLFAYFAYTLNAGDDFLSVNCGSDDSVGVVCSIGKGLVAWIALF